MRICIKLFVLFILVGMASCSTDFTGTDGDVTKSSDGETYSTDSGSSSSGSSSDPGTGNNPGGEKGKVTAAEWNDLENWQFWTELLQKDEFTKFDSTWSVYTTQRYSVEITGYPKVNNVVQLKGDDKVIWEAVSDLKGKAELFYEPFAISTTTKPVQLELFVNGNKVAGTIKSYTEGVNYVEVNRKPPVNDLVELAFIVDATGSMGDELEFLKQDLKDVIERVKSDNGNLDIRTASVFYRDESDEYVVKSSSFTSSLSKTIDFIKDQRADGGGDFPEAVHSALEVTFGKLEWSKLTRSKIAFLLLDAPPHGDAQVLSSIHKQIKAAAKLGVKLIPISASGIDKSTEYLLRTFSIMTNSTYVFITNDSGIGDEHIEASVGEYEVEYLNDLMVRLIKKYTED